MKVGTGVLARIATTGIYLVSGVSRGLQRAARVRAVSEGTTLRTVLVKALAEYATGNWTPHPDAQSRESVTTSRRLSSGSKKDARCK
jgi:hypothetical protein